MNIQPPPQSAFNSVYMGLQKPIRKFTFLRLIAEFFNIQETCTMFNIRPVMLNVCELYSINDYNYANFEPSFEQYTKQQMQCMADLLERRTLLTIEDINEMFVFPDVEIQIRENMQNALLNYLNNFILFNVIALRYPHRITSDHPPIPRYINRANENQVHLNNVFQIECRLNGKFRLNLDTLNRLTRFDYITNNLLTCMEKLSAEDFSNLFTAFNSLHIQ